jgi:hypothetical protein
MPRLRRVWESGAMKLVTTNGSIVVVMLDGKKVVPR